MTDEEALFEVWFQLYRATEWKRSRPDRAHESPSEVYCMGLRGHYLEGWMARASLHVTSAHTFNPEGQS
jgi:hypothetical protein